MITNDDVYCNGFGSGGYVLEVWSVLEIFQRGELRLLRLTFLLVEFPRRLLNN